MTTFVGPLSQLKGDPLGYPRNPLAIFLLLLALVSGLGMLFGQTTARSVEASLPHALATSWAIILTFGAGITLVGMFWQGDVRTGLLMKKIGMLSVGIAATLYGLIVILALGTGAVFAGGVTSTFGIACFLQFRQINARIYQIMHETKRQRQS